MTIKQRLKEKKPILLDGAMGTELQRRGVNTSLPLWSTQALISHPEIVQQIHEDYINAGAEIITTNTFRTNVRTIRKADIEKSPNELTHLAVELTKKAREKTGGNVIIAGSMAPVEDCFSPELVPSIDELLEEHSTLAHQLRDAGVDLILIETMNTITEAEIAARAATETGLDTFVSFVVGPNGDLLSGEGLADGITALESYNISAILLNCLPIKATIEPLKILSTTTSLPPGIYAHGIGKPDDKLGWKFAGGERINEYLEYVKQWLDMGVKIVGGCCGTTPEYIERIHTYLSTSSGSA